MTPPIKGLRQAFGKYTNDDPLGIGLHQRSVDEERDAANSIPFGSDDFGQAHSDALRNLINSESDVQGFGDMLQAIKERAPGGIRNPGAHGDPLPGLPNAPFGLPSTFDPAYRVPTAAPTTPTVPPAPKRTF